MNGTFRLHINTVMIGFIVSNSLQSYVLRGTASKNFDYLCVHLACCDLNT